MGSETRPDVAIVTNEGHVGESQLFYAGLPITGNRISDIITLPSEAELQAFGQKIFPIPTTCVADIERVHHALDKFYSHPGHSSFRKETFSPDIILKNSNLSDSARIVEAQCLLGVEQFTDSQEKAIVAAHAYSTSKGGTFLMDDGAKIVRGRKLAQAGFTSQQVQLLGDSGLCGMGGIVAGVIMIAYYVGGVLLVENISDLVGDNDIAIHAVYGGAYPLLLFVYILLNQGKLSGLNRQKLFEALSANNIVLALQSTLSTLHGVSFATDEGCNQLLDILRTMPGTPSLLGAILVIWMVIGQDKLGAGAIAEKENRST